MIEKKRYKLIVCKVLQREAYLCAANSPNIVDVELLPQGLHNEPDKLRDELTKAIENITDIQGNRYNALLLGYGLCSRGIVGLSPTIELVVPRAHDCITLMLGSKEKYREYFDTNPGAYWYTPGWIETGTQPGEDRNDKLLKEYLEKYGEDNAEYLMEVEEGWIKEYSKATYISSKIPSDQEFREYTRQCAEYLNWSFDEIKGDNGLMQRLADGCWGEDEFLIVGPGRKIAEDLTSAGLIKEE